MVYVASDLFLIVFYDTGNKSKRQRIDSSGDESDSGVDFLPPDKGTLKPTLTSVPSETIAIFNARKGCSH